MIYIFKYLLYSLIIYNSSAFIMTPMLSYQPLKQNNLSLLQMSKNASKIYKLDFSEDMEAPEDKPIYAFGLSEFQMILIRIYVNMVIIIYILRLVFE